MKLKLIRYSDNGKNTLGLLFINNKFFCYTIEDTKRDDKILGKTRIPEGTYNIRKYYVSTPKTILYKKKFPWFDFHFMLVDVPNFTNIYIHIGNDEEDSNGCILVGNKTSANTFFNGFIYNSTNTFKELYQILSSVNDNIEIEIVNNEQG